MNGKKWLTGFLLILFIGISGYMILNYCLDPMGYFAVEHKDEVIDSEKYTRAAKVKYLKEHKDEFDAVLIAGSKGGVFDDELLQEYSGLRYYNVYSNLGTFSDYLAIVKFIAKETDIKEITLHLSSFDSIYYDRSDEGTNMKVPKVLSGNKWEQFTEFLSFLMTDTNSMRTRIKELKDGTDSGIVMLMHNGVRLCRDFILKFAAGGEDYQKYINKYVLKSFDSDMKNLINGKSGNYRKSYPLNLAALREIKDICDENGITLNVMIGAVFLSERSLYEGTNYYDYLLQVVNIVGKVWDFSGFCDINSNPYNFINRKHYSYAVADLQLAIMYGVDQYEGFGIELTPDNIMEYLAKRKSDCEKVVKEYQETGSIQMPDREDASFIHWDQERMEKYTMLAQEK